MHDHDSHAVLDRWNYAYTNHRVASITSSAMSGSTKMQFVYDAVGSTTQRESFGTNAANKTFVYDSYNRQLTSAVGGNTVGTYTYDDAGFRVRKVSQETVGAQTSLVELEAPNKYFAIEKQKDLGGTPIANTEYALNNIYLNGMRVASVIPGGAARYFMTDQLDSVNLVTNDTGGIVTRHEYLPFGEQWFSEGETSYKPKYNSQEFDSESGLYFFNARHQDPEIGRFSQADSIIDGEYDTQGWNRYSYVKNNPVNFRDPTGHEIRFSEKFENEFRTNKEFRSQVTAYFSSKAGQEQFRRLDADKRITYYDAADLKGDPINSKTVQGNTRAITQGSNGKLDTTAPGEKIDGTVVVLHAKGMNTADTMYHEGKHVQNAYKAGAKNSQLSVLEENFHAEDGKYSSSAAREMKEFNSQADHAKYMSQEAHDKSQQNGIEGLIRSHRADPSDKVNQRLQELANENIKSAIKKNTR